MALSWEDAKQFAQSGGYAKHGTVENWQQGTTPAAVSTPASNPQSASQGTPGQATQGQATKVPGGWQLADGTFVPVPSAGQPTSQPMKPTVPEKNMQWMPISQPTTQAPAQQANPAASPSNGAANAQSYIDQLIAAQKNAAVSALGKSRDNALSNLGAEKSAIQPKFQDARNQAGAGAQQQSRNFAEYMANRGGASSGANAQAQISNNMALQGSLGALGQQETAAYTDIGRRTTDVGNAYESDVASSSAGLEADRMKALLNDFYVAQQRGDTQAQNDIQNKINQAQLQLQQQQLSQTQSNADRAFNYGVGRDQVGDANYKDETQYTRGQDQVANSIGLAGVTGYYNPSGMSASQINQEIAKNSAAWGNATPEQQQQLHSRNVELNALLGKTDSTGSGDYVGGNPNGSVGQRTVAGQQLDINQQIDQRNFDYTKGIDTRNFDYTKAQDAIKTGQWDKSFDMEMEKWADAKNLNWAQFDQSTKQALAQIAISQQNANSTDQNRKDDNAYRDEQAKASRIATETAATQKQAAAQVEKMTKERQGLVTAIRNNQVTPEQALKQIQEDEKLGFYTPQEAQEMASTVNTLTGKVAPTFPGNRGTENPLDKYLWLNKK